MKNVLEYLEESFHRHPDKLAARDERTSCTYRELITEAKNIGIKLVGKMTEYEGEAGLKPVDSQCRAPSIIAQGESKSVVVFMEKGVAALKAFMGILYAGCFYTLVDTSFPAERIRQIFHTLENRVVITERQYEAFLRETGYQGEILCMDDNAYIGEGGKTGNELLARIRQQATDTDPVYCNFTSGSTGIPKGVLICHRSIIDFIDCFTRLFHITGEDVIGNQAPFDFDVSVKDIYSALKTGATLVIIPRSHFMFPNRVVDMLDETGVTTLIWAVSALCLLNRLHAFKYKVPSRINKVLFSGEVMPVKQLNAWREYYPDALFVNLYGPTEITCNCTYYVLDRTFSEEDVLPIGAAFPNKKVFLLDDDNREITNARPFTQGELCVAGTSLALGYYNDSEMTAAAFVQNPLQPHYPEIIYRTGDLAYWNDERLLCFAGRKDFQIKHMGHRIELEEVERALGGVSIIESACCFFDEEKSRVIACYTGTDDKKKIVEEMRRRVPDYMVPNVFLYMDRLPLTKNGKTDRGFLKRQYKESIQSKAESGCDREV